MINEKILLIDDEPDIRELLESVLRGEGYEIFTAADGEEGIALFREKKPDLIITDIRMPKMNGIEVLQTVRSAGSDVDVIILTGQGDEATAISSLHQGAYDYIKKPLDDIETLINTVRRALRKRQLEKEKQALMGRLFDGSGHGILVADSETRRFVLANRSICRMFGYSDAQLKQLSVADIHPKDLLSLVMTEFDNFVRGEKAISFGLPCLRKDGTVFYADIAGSSTIIEGRMCVVGFFVDVTNRKLMELELAEQAHNLATMNQKILEASVAVEQARDLAERASSAKSEFIMNISHEFRTPLNHIVGFTQVLQDEFAGPLNVQQCQYLEKLAGGADHLRKLIESILQFAQLDKGDEVLQSTTFQLKEFLGAVVDAWRDEAVKRSIQLNIKLGVTAQTVINTDPDKLRAVMNHLLSNALRFNKEGGSVHVAAGLVLSSEFEVKKGEPNAEVKTDFIEISVADTGIGIRGEDMTRLFKPFTQLEATLTKTYAGIGMGLALTKYLVELLGGYIRVESDFGQGSRFIFTLPA